MIIKDPQQDLLDELLNSVDLSTYGLKHIKLNETLMLYANESELDPQNPNLRGAHGGDKDEDPLDQIINRFNERWFQGWEATPEDQRITMLNLKNKVMAHQDFVP